MKKNITAQNGAIGIRLTALGYAMKASPGPEIKHITDRPIHARCCTPRNKRVEGDAADLPDSATDSTDTPCWCAMNPSTLKMAKPAYSDVKLLMLAMITQSLQQETESGPETRVQPEKVQFTPSRDRTVLLTSPKAATRVTTATAEQSRAQPVWGVLTCNSCW